MSRFRFYLNGQLLKDQPEGWQDFTESIVRDRDIYGITIEYENDLTFAGDGYVILENAFKDSNCGELELVIQQKDCGQWQELSRLLIKTSDIVTNLNRCTVKAKTTDSTYYGLIHNNRTVPVRMATKRTKNGVVMDECPINDVSFFKPEQETDQIAFYFNPRQGFDAIDAIETVLTFITDGQITEVESNFYNTLQYNVPGGSPEFDYGAMKFMFFLGEQIRTAGETNLDLTFEGIIKTMHTMHGVWWMIKDGKLILEREDFFFAEDYIDEPSLRDVTRETDTAMLYSSVQLGSPKSEDETFVSNTYPDPINYSMPRIDLVSHSKQNYPLTGVCNTDKVLNLIPEYVIDSNLIEKVLDIGENTPADERPDQGADSDIFYIQCVYDDTNDRWLTCWSTYFLLPTTPVRGYTFNPDLLNSEVVKRHSVQSDYSLYFTGEDDKFRASVNGTFNSGDGGQVIATFPAGGIDGNPLNTAFGSIAAVRYNDDTTPPNFNNNNNYDTTAFVFEAPATSVYGFETKVFVKKILDIVQRGGAQIFEIQNIPNAANQNYNTVPYLLCRLTCDILENDGTTYVIEGAPISDHFLLNWETSAGFPLQVGTFNIAGQSGFPPQWIVQLVRSEAALWLNPMNNGWEIPKESPLGSGLFYLLAGQKIRVRLNVTTFPHYARVALDDYRQVRYAVQNDSWFECVWALPTGGTFEPVNPDLHRALLYTFSKPMTVSRWNQIKENPTLGFRITPALDKFVKAHIRRVTRNLNTGATDYELIGNRNQINF